MYPVNRATPIATAIVMAALLGASAATAADAPPAVGSGPGPVTDGVRQVAVISNGAVVGYDTHRRRVIGRVPLPRSSDPRGFSLHTAGIFDGRVLVAGSDLSDPPAEGNETLLALADLRSGTFTWLCGRDKQPGPASALCPGVARPSGPLASATTFTAGGSRWLRVTSYSKVLKWSVTADGVFRWRDARPSERRTIRDIGPDAVDLNASRLRQNDRFGYTWRNVYRPSWDVRVRPERDRRAGVLRLRQGAGVPGVSFASLGVCARVNDSLFVWDKRTGRVWRRDLHGGRYDDRTVKCAGRTLIVAHTLGTDQPLDWSLRWPTLSSHKGWRSLGVLRPGQRITLH